MWSYKNGFLPLSTVSGLMNVCVQSSVAELVLLLPLLLRLRQPGADAAKLGPTVEEQNWSGLDEVNFIRYRENVHFQTDKRRRVCHKFTLMFLTFPDF